MNEQYIKLIAAVSPAIVLTLIIICRDRRREPIRWLLTAVAFGILTVPAVLLLGYTVIPDFPADTLIGAILNSFIGAAIPEEGMKFAALYLLASRCRHFDEMFDGIVYCVCIGMGFAGIENILYLFDAEEGWVYVGVARALMSVPMHYVFAIIMGSFFALGWFDRRNRRVYMSAALVLPITVHGLYDTFCFTMGLNENLSMFILGAFLIGFRWIRRYVKNLTNSMRQLDGQIR